MSERFFVETPIVSASASLFGTEAHHLMHVLRARVGQEVTLFDGSGAEFHARIAALARSHVELEVLERRDVDRESPIGITLGVALPKGDRQRWLVEKVVELGVKRLIPLKTQRGVVQPAESALSRLRRTVIEASKQCGRNRLLEIMPPCQWDQFVASADSRESCRLVADAAATVIASRIPVAPQHATWLAVGPEGGFSREEIALAHHHGWQSISLGPRTLRVETAAIQLCAIVAASCDAPS